MKINFKNKMYIYHPDGKFTEAQLCELLEAVRKMGYDEGYEAAKAYYNKPNWWYYTTTPTITSPYITCTSDSTNSNLTSTTATATSDINSNKTYTISNTTKLTNEEINNILGIKNPKTLEFRYDGTER
jgi:hypothetical protein